MEIDEIVTEVKESEEWVGIEVCKSLDVGRDETIQKIVEKFALNKDDAEKYMEMYW